MTIKNRMHEAIWTAIDNMVIPRVVTAVKSIIGSTGYGTNSDVQNSDRMDCTGKIKNTSLVSATSRLDLDAELNRKDETRNNVDFENGDILALNQNYDRGDYAHHMVTGHTAPENSVPEYLTGRIQTQKN